MDLTTPGVSTPFTPHMPTPSNLQRVSLFEFNLMPDEWDAWQQFRRSTSVQDQINEENEEYLRG